VTAHGELISWLTSMAETDSSLLPPDGWQFATLDPARSRRAAVLILFGAREATPADRGRNALHHDELDLLFVMRASTLAHHPGQVAFPGGAIDEGDEDEAAAALREAREETGLLTGGVEILGLLPEVGLPVSNFMVTPVLGWWAEQSPVHAVDTAECEVVFRCPVSTLLDATQRRTAVLRRDGFVSRTPAFLTPDATIWGFTAMLLDAMFDGLGWTRPWDQAQEIPAPL
jgi:8-oxo-dGTP pyrophosphatase MutT (NUDIX family)